MNWQKKGVIFKASQRYFWSQTHAQKPVVEIFDETTLRIYYSTRDIKGHSFISFFDVDANNPSIVKYEHNEPILSPGKLGTFDDCGAMTSCIVNDNGKKYFYYLGWNVRNTIAYHISIGLSVSEENSSVFEKFADGPILDRFYKEPYLCTSCDVLKEADKWKMWYTSGTKWCEAGSKTEPYYHIKYAESFDGINWNRNAVVALDYKDENECAVACPCVIKENGIYKMWFSYRGIINYRTDSSQSYRIGYAESVDGINWVRKDAEVGIDVSSEGWDSQMIAYAYVISVNDRKYMFYNGNGFGQSGIGYAILEK